MGLCCCGKLPASCNAARRQQLLWGLFQGCLCCSLPSPGLWGCFRAACAAHCHHPGTDHSLSSCLQVTGKCGSVTVRLIPAPRGAGIVAARTPKKVLQMAGIEDCFTVSRGSTKTLGNFVKVLRFACLRVRVRARAHVCVCDASGARLAHH